MNRPGLRTFQCKSISRREHPSCLFSCCFRTFSISLETFLRSPRLALPLSFSRQITDESCRRKRKAREKPYVSLSVSLSLFASEYVFRELPVRRFFFICSLLHTINELQAAQHSRSAQELAYIYKFNNNRSTLYVVVALHYLRADYDYITLGATLC